MTLDIFILQFTLGIILFLIINWIGKHSYSVGYISISLFARAEEAPAFNYVLRVLTPIVFLIIAATLLYLMKLDKYTYNFYLVSVYYIAFRLIVNIVTGRGLLLNWGRQILYWASIITASYFTYSKIISIKGNILPDFTTIANELWIIIIVFLYQVTNNVELSNKGTIRRKEDYLRKSFHKFKTLYSNIIQSKLEEPKLQALAYAIIIFENFNRPKLIRIIENIRFIITKKPHTLGVMQVTSKTLINDMESVVKGVEIIKNSYLKHLNLFENGKKEYVYYSDHLLIYDIIEDYNSGTQYRDEINKLLETISELYFKNTSHLITEQVTENEEAE